MQINCVGLGKLIIDFPVNRSMFALIYKLISLLFDLSLEPAVTLYQFPLYLMS